MFKGKAFSPGFEHIWGLDSEQALVSISVYRSLSSVLLSISVSWAPVLVSIPVYLSVSSSLCSISIALVPVYSRVLVPVYSQASASFSPLYVQVLPSVPLIVQVLLFVPLIEFQFS